MTPQKERGLNRPLPRTVSIHFLTAGIEPARRLSHVCRRPTVPPVVGADFNA
jgi:hypothetical protein